MSFMAVLPKEDRLALLAQSSYGRSRVKSTSAQQTSSAEKYSGHEKRRKTGFRSLSSVQVDNIKTADGRIDTKRLNQMIGDPQSKISENPHKQEIERLEAKPELIDKDREHYDQTIFFSVIFELFPMEYLMTCATPNGGLRDKGVRWRLLAEGQRPGWPDTQCSIPSNGYSGLYIEFKKPIEYFKSSSEARRAVKEHQRSTLRMLAYFGYAVFVAYGWQEGVEIYKAYFNKSNRNMDELILFYPKELLLPPTEGEILEFARNNFEFSESLRCDKG